MLFCPYCGISVKEDEKYCMNCGEQLPDDIEKRFKKKKRLNRLWYIPLSLFIIILLSLIPFYSLLQNQNSQAKELYDKGEKSVLDEDYQSARDYFEQALTLKRNFYDADVSLKFVKHVIKIEDYLADALQKLDQLDFQEALTLVNEAENLLKNYHGSAVTEVINKILTLRNEISISQINFQLNDQPNIHDLKGLLWEAEAIKTEEAELLTKMIRDQIIDYTFSNANKKLNNKQFIDAQLLVEDGLKYAADSEKLQSLRTTIDKEKTAFEIAEQQRIEQAIHMAEEDRELNEQDAIELENVSIEQDDQDNLIVKGKVKSVATIPVHSILIEYSLQYKNIDIEKNKVFVYPEKLYPGETGKFEFTHYEMNKNIENTKINVDKIKWYTD